MKYVIQKTTGSYCPHCDGLVHLLIEEVPMAPVRLPMFYICFECETVLQVGVGEVERVEDDI
jgi:hypothetical protein